MELISSPFRRIFQRAGFRKIEDSAVDLWRDFVEQLTILAAKQLKEKKGKDKLELNDMKELLEKLKALLEID
ncbi:MAG: hypothetical protein GXO42_02665 [bacterium]|nr:hypothetical protein [bacterium]